MQIGIVGLGRMGGNIARRLIKAGRSCVVFDANPAAAQALAREGAQAAASLEAMVRALPTPRAVWSMLPAGQITEGVVQALGGLLEADDVIIDVLTSALFTRFRSRQEHTFAERMLSAMRFGFGGHVEGHS